MNARLPRPSPQRGGDVVAVVTDSAANLPAELARDLGIAVVPLELRFGDEAFRDGIDMAGDAFYDRLVDDSSPATTAAPSPAAFLEGFLGTGERDVLCVTLSAELSGTHHQAHLATEGFTGRIEIVDSRSATMGEGFVALAAARAAREGRSLDDVANRARAVADRVGVYGVIETFEYLRRSGRVSKLQAYAATMLDIKPVFRLERGVIEPVARPRTRRKALARIADDVVEAVSGRSARIAVFHAQAADDARDLLDRIASRTDVGESFLTPCTPAIGVHTGPGLVGVAFHTDEPD
jgi:DegV family protein with EDD domain